MTNQEIGTYQAIEHVFRENSYQDQQKVKLTAYVNHVCMCSKRKMAITDENETVGVRVLLKDEHEDFDCKKLNGKKVAVAGKIIKGEVKSHHHGTNHHSHNDSKKEIRDYYILCDNYEIVE